MSGLFEISLDRTNFEGFFKDIYFLAKIRCICMINYLRLFKQTWDMWPSAVAKRLRHFSHFSSVTSPLVCIIACLLRASHLLKSSEHFSQRYLVVPVCKFSCLRWSLDCLKAFGQNEHLKGRSPVGWRKYGKWLSGIVKVKSVCQDNFLRLKYLKKCAILYASDSLPTYREPACFPVLILL